ncbi:MAG: hypothetical protein OEZ39_08490 [Gammaproteobacteria bacterium]|nr:hypothetical protein [Gammaproteobacteria bacterium]MDH5651900.1 hypothetical protein [Gammaproteobacteria bacterium]
MINQFLRYVKPLLLILTLVLLAGCTPGGSGFNRENLAGVGYGFLHGLISPFTLVASFFTNSVRFYEIHNTGPWYDVGFLFGFLVLIAGGSETKPRNGKKQSDDDEEENDDDKTEHTVKVEIYTNGKDDRYRVERYREENEERDRKNDRDRNRDGDDEEQEQRIRSAPQPEVDWDALSEEVQTNILARIKEWSESDSGTSGSSMNAWEMVDARMEERLKKNLGDWLKDEIKRRNDN